MTDELAPRDGPDLAYQCMPKARLSEGRMSISAVQPRHIEHIRQWRNAQMDVLRQSSEISPAQQKAYFAAKIWPQMAVPRPSEVLVSYEEDGVPVGYGGLVHLSWENRRGEISFLLAPALAAQPDAYAVYFITYLTLIRRLAFEDLQLARVFTETYASRSHHIAILEAAGMRREGVLHHHVMIDGKFVDSIMHGYLAAYDGPRAQ